MSQNHAVAGNPGLNYWYCLKPVLIVDESRPVLQTMLWTALPAQVGISVDSPAWIIMMLTSTGVAVGLVIRFSLCRHARPDAALEPLGLVPRSLLQRYVAIIALIIGLAGGVSSEAGTPGSWRSTSVWRCISAHAFYRVIGALTERFWHRLHHWRALRYARSRPR